MGVVEVVDDVDDELVKIGDFVMLLIVVFVLIMEDDVVVVVYGKGGVVEDVEFVLD